MTDPTKDRGDLQTLEGKIRQWGPTKGVSFLGDFVDLAPAMGQRGAQAGSAGCARTPGPDQRGLYRVGSKGAGRGDRR